MREYLVNINDKSYTVAVKSIEDDIAELEINGKLYSVKLDEPMQSVSDNNPAPPRPQATPAISAPTSSAPPANTQSSGTNSEVIRAPIPGSILAVMCKEGDKVKAGQALIKMEAMKMENDIRTNVDGVVEEIKVNTGDAVPQGGELIVVKKDV